MLDRVSERAPHAPALVGGDARLRYGEMASVVRRVARHVEAMVQPGHAIATLLPQTPLGVAGLLGCCASGRVCIVLNPADPAPRLSAILDDTKPSAVITDVPDAHWPGLPRHLTLHDAAASDDAVGWRPSAAPGLDDPALVYATSGSTGRPRTIACSLHAMLFRATISAEGLQITPGSVVLATALPSVASGFAFVLGTLLAGGCMLVIDFARDGASALLRLALRERATVLVAPPPLMAMLRRLPGAPEAFASLRLVRSSATGLLQADMRLWRAILPPGCIVSHTYASTEATIVAEWYVPPDYADPAPYLPVGSPRREHELALLDEAGHPVAPGAAGELVVTSPYVALGEWRDGRLVESRMAAVDGRPGWRAFRTGDVMRLAPDGLMRFVSRVDRQIKVNAVRIEPGEIEAVLRAELGVTAAIVAPRAHEAAIDAFVEARGQDAAALRAALRARLANALPRSLRPSRIVVVEAFPMLRDAKVDLLALRALADREPGS